MSVQIRRFEDADGVARAAADAGLSVIAEAIAQRGVAHVVLTGGTVGIATLASIADNPRHTDTDFEKVHFWWGDERFVAADSADRNALQAENALLGKLTLDRMKVHGFPSSEEFGGNLDQAAEAFAAELAAVAEKNQPLPRFDLVYLGMGPDGHIASLFPGKPAPAPGLTVVAEHDSPKPPPQRLSLTFEALNSADRVWFVVAGADKAAAAAEALADTGSTLPAARVKGTSETTWFIDAAAAAEIG